MAGDCFWRLPWSFGLEKVVELEDTHCPMKFEEEAVEVDCFSTMKLDLMFEEGEEEAAAHYSWKLIE